jgi:hypothetical protein
MMDSPIGAARSGRARRQTNPTEAVRDAFRRRAAQAIDHIARSASGEALTEALAAPTDFGAVARAMGDASAFPAALQLDPLADALARGAAEREQLVVKAAGLLSADAAGRAVGITRQAIDKRRRGRQLLAVKVGNDWRYPAAQFGSAGEAVPGLAGILDALADLQPWAVLDFLLADDAALGGISPLEALRRGGDVAADAQRIAHAYATDAFG